MLIKDCFKGQRVVFKENGRPATILSVSHTAGKVTIAFDSAERREVSASALDPAGEEASRRTEEGTPTRPCPNCATRMPLDSHVCPKCGFQYGVKTGSAAGKVFKFLVILVILGGIAWAIWTYVLPKLGF